MSAIYGLTLRNALLMHQAGNCSILYNTRRCLARTACSRFHFRPVLRTSPSICTAYRTYLASSSSYDSQRLLLLVRRLLSMPHVDSLVRRAASPTGTLDASLDCSLALSLWAPPSSRPSVRLCSPYSAARWRAGKCSLGIASRPSGRNIWLTSWSHVALRA